MQTLITYLTLFFTALVMQAQTETSTVNYTDTTPTKYQQGMKKAFLQYISKEGVLLRPGYLPIVGADAIDYLSQVNDTAFKISWVPTHGEIANSGELGYTYGVYTLATADTTLKGTYVSIWKKQADGEWKFVLDSGNEGVGSNPR